MIAKLKKIFIFILEFIRNNVCYYKNVSEQDALNLLQFYCPSLVNSTCMCSNEIVHVYDLQIIVPAYKVEKYIKECIDSILNQKSRYSVLLVVINDGSPDKTRDILRQYKNCKHVRIVDQENRGLSGARNTGLKFIEARYVTFIDSDDMLMSGAIDSWMEAAYANDADIVEGGYVTFNDTTHVIRSYSHESLITNKWEGLLFGYSWGKVYRSELFKSICFPEKYWFEDTINAMIVYPLSKKNVLLDKIVYRYRLNSQGITATSVANAKILDTIYITKQILQDKENMNIPVTQEDYEFFLKQVIVNYSRISTLRNSLINQAVFCLTCELIQYYFKGFLTNRSSVRKLELSLYNRSFRGYMNFFYLKKVMSVRRIFIKL